MYARGGVEYGIEEGRYLNAVYEVRSFFLCGVCVVSSSFFWLFFEDMVRVGAYDDSCRLTLQTLVRGERARASCEDIL